MKPAIACFRLIEDLENKRASAAQNTDHAHFDAVDHRQRYSISQTKSYATLRQGGRIAQMAKHEPRASMDTSTHEKTS